MLEGGAAARGCVVARGEGAEEGEAAALRGGGGRGRRQVQDDGRRHHAEGLRRCELS